MALQRRGSATKIDYEANFYTYLKYLIKGRTENKALVKQLFWTWNDYFFPSVAGPTATFATIPTHSIDAEFAALQDDDDDNDTEYSIPLPPSSRRGIADAPNNSPKPALVVIHKGERGKGKGRQPVQSNMGIKPHTCRTRLSWFSLVVATYFRK